MRTHFATLFKVVATLWIGVHQHFAAAEQNGGGVPSSSKLKAITNHVEKPASVSSNSDRGLTYLPDTTKIHKIFGPPTMTWNELQSQVHETFGIGLDEIVGLLDSGSCQPKDAESLSKLKNLIAFKGIKKKGLDVTYNYSHFEIKNGKPHCVRKSGLTWEGYRNLCHSHSDDPQAPRLFEIDRVKGFEFAASIYVLIQDLIDPGASPSHAGKDNSKKGNPSAGKDGIQYSRSKWASVSPMLAYWLASKMQSKSGLTVEQYDSGAIAIYNNKSELLYISDIVADIERSPLETKEVQELIVSRMVSNSRGIHRKEYSNLFRKLRSGGEVEPQDAEFLTRSWQGHGDEPCAQCPEGYDEERELYNILLVFACVADIRVKAKSLEEFSRYDCAKFANSIWGADKTPLDYRELTGTTVEKLVGKSPWNSFLWEATEVQRQYKALEPHLARFRATRVLNTVDHETLLQNRYKQLLDFWDKRAFKDAMIGFPSENTSLRRLSLFIEKQLKVEDDEQLWKVARLVKVQGKLGLLLIKKTNRDEGPNDRLIMVIPQDLQKLKSCELEIKDVTDADENAIKAAVLDARVKKSIAEHYVQICEAPITQVWSPMEGAFLATNLIKKANLETLPLKYRHVGVWGIFGRECSSVPISLRGVLPSDLSHEVPPPRTGAKSWCDVFQKHGLEYRDDNVLLIGRDYSITTDLNAELLDVRSHSPVPMFANSLFDFGVQMSRRTHTLLQENLKSTSVFGIWQTDLGMLMVYSNNTFDITMPVLNADGTPYIDGRGAAFKVPTQTISGTAEFNAASGELELHGKTYFFGRRDVLTARVFYSFKQCADVMVGNLNATRRREFSK